MATTKPTFQNQTARSLAVLKYNFSCFNLAPGKYVTGAYYLEHSLLNQVDTGIPIYSILGLTDVSSGVDPDPADIIYDYVATEEVNTMPIYANNAAAKAGGLIEGNFYRSGGDPDPVCIVH
jgi:hypothetical protein